MRALEEMERILNDFSWNKHSKSEQSEKVNHDPVVVYLTLRHCAIGEKPAMLPGMATKKNLGIDVLSPVLMV